MCMKTNNFKPGRIRTYAKAEGTPAPFANPRPANLALSQTKSASAETDAPKEDLIDRVKPAELTRLQRVPQRPWCLFRPASSDSRRDTLAMQSSSASQERFDWFPLASA